MCCAGQPVILVGDLNADPTIIPTQLLLSVEELPQPVPASFNWMKIRAYVGISLWLVLLLWPPPLHVVSCLIAGSPRTLPSSRSFRSLHGTPLFIWPESILLSGQPVGSIVLIGPDVLRLGRSRIFGMFTFVKSVSFLVRFVSNSSLLVTPPMLMLLGVFGEGKPRRVLLVPISRLVVLPY